MLPSFFIVGERKCGTSSLYRYLVAHPQILPCKVKEPNFFSKPWWKIVRGFKKYQSLFPALNQEGSIEFQWPELDENGRLFTETISVERQVGMSYITGEASVNTFYYANPRLVKWLLPDVKIILMLREPAERTFSHYRMLERFKREGRKTISLQDFSTDMKIEMEKVSRGKESMVLSPSVYAKKLPVWLNLFGKDRLFIIRSEDMEDQKKTESIMKRLFRFLEVADFEMGDMLSQRFNVAPPESMPEDIQQELVEFFEPYNKQLEDLLGVKLY